jgi:phosphohistidine phosphatase
MGQYLAAMQQTPDGIVSSSALRALDTVRRAAEAGKWTCPVETTDKLYGASTDQALDVVRELENSRSSVLLAGHEPTWSQLAGDLVGGADVRFPTAALARIDLAVDKWKHAEFGKGTLIWLVIPKLLSRIGWPEGPSSKK